MNHLRILWAKWRLSCATEELAMFQARFDVQPGYLVNTMQHIGYLRNAIKRLSPTDLISNTGENT